MLCKLDAYNYEVLPGVIKILVDSVNDPVMLDILSEISLADGRVYVEGNYYSYLDEYSVYTRDRATYIELKVQQTNRGG